MRIQEYIQAFIQGWWIILATLLIGVGVTYIYSYSQDTEYLATATYLASSKLETVDPRDLIQSEDTLSARAPVVNTYCGILESQTIIESAVVSLGLQADLTGQYHVNCSVFPDSNIMGLEVRGPSPNLAADIANAIGTEGMQFINDLQEVYELHSLDAAVADPEPVAPDHFVDLILGVVISIIGGVALVLLRQIFIGLSAEQTIEPAS